MVFAMIVNKQHAGIGPWASVGLIGLMAWMICGGTILAGTLRHDRAIGPDGEFDDSLYTELAALSQYDCAGMVELETSTGTSVGSGTLIASRYVLTAGHMVGNGASFTVNGTTYQSVYDGYRQHSSEDIGILELTEPVSVEDVLPATLYEPSFESAVGLDGTMVGFGYTGDGEDGEDRNGPLGIKRAGQNRIDATGEFSNWNWSPNLLLVDFDSPDGWNSTMGPSLPLDLEMGPAHGDSGCGLFVELSGQTYLAGVQSLMWYSDRTDNADYGDGGVFVSVRQTFDWIESIVSPLPGDANRDNVVNAADAAILAEHWQTTGVGWSDGDFNSDGIIDDADATIMAANWLAVREPQAAVPEPNSLALVGGLLFCGTFFVLFSPVRLRPVRNC